VGLARADRELGRRSTRWRGVRRGALLAALAPLSATAVAAALLGAGSALYFAYVTVSLMLGGVAATTLVWTLHAWRTPDSLSDSGSADIDLGPAHSFSLIVPAREEESVLESTLSQLMMSSHPRFEVLVVVGDDDPGTLAAAERVAERHPEIVRVIVDTGVPKSKPTALNAALPHCTGELTGVFDAEDHVHPALLTRVDQRFQMTGADVVQAGVQLMNFHSSWLTVRNVLEYYFWFRSRLHLHARQRFIPLGGNTVFVRTPILRAVGGWDPSCLAEDCELGVRLSALGAHTVVFYDPELVTQEECPPTLGAFIRQRTRWNQGYLQTLAKGYWRRLPLRQRALGAYILAMPYLMALAWVLIPVALATAIAVNAPVGVTLISFVPALPVVSMLLAEIVALGEFCREYHQRASIRDYLRLVAGLPFYQAVLTFASARAVTREARGARGWEKTEHLGLHLEPPARGQAALPAAPLRRLPSPEPGRLPSGASLRDPAPNQAVPAFAVEVRIERGRAKYVSKARSGAVLAPGPGVLAALQRQALWTRLDSLSPNGIASLAPPAVGPVGAAEAALRWLRSAAQLLRGAAFSRADLVVQVVLLAVVGTVLATNALHWPATQFDEGTYVANAWAVQHGKLAPYTYSYGHPPLAWLLIFLWTSATGLVGHTSFSIDVGRGFLVFVSLVSCSLLYILARRLNFGRIAASAAVILFALSPVAIFFHRAVLLDNPSMAWALAAFVLARTPERRLWAFAGSGACFAASVLCKETSLVLLPVLIVATVQNTDPRTRRYCWTLLLSFFVVVAVSYPLYAALKGELLPGRGHVSLIGSMVVQLVTRKGTGSVFHTHSETLGILAQWLQRDPWLLGAALALSPVALARRSTRFVALAFLIQVLMILRPGYLPNMYVIQLLPFAALIVPGAIEALSRRWRRLSNRVGAFLLAAIVTIPALVVLSAVIVRWAGEDSAAMTAQMDGSTRAAQRWIIDHIARDQRLIVSDDFYVYLIQHGFNHEPVNGGYFSKTVVSYWPLDYDPALRRHFPQGWRDFDYVVSTEAMRDGTNQTPTAGQALAHSATVASFGREAQRIEIRKIMSRPG
jgi:cellulose synthase/poly-beta-1,6-N-acetylglucosamine synthase-like glycosyltransferase